MTRLNLSTGRLSGSLEPFGTIGVSLIVEGEKRDFVRGRRREGVESFPVEVRR